MLGTVEREACSFVVELVALDVLGEHRRRTYKHRVLAIQADVGHMRFTRHGMDELAKDPVLAAFEVPVDARLNRGRRLDDVGPILQRPHFSNDKHLWKRLVQR